jgi:hypothetical protein
MMQFSRLTSEQQVAEVETALREGCPADAVSLCMWFEQGEHEYPGIVEALERVRVTR